MEDAKLLKAKIHNNHVKRKMQAAKTLGDEAQGLKGDEWVTVPFGSELAVLTWHIMLQAALPDLV